MPRDWELTDDALYDDKYGRYDDGNDDDDDAGQSYRRSSQYYNSGRSGRERDRSPERRSYRGDTKHLQRHSNEEPVMSGGRYPDEKAESIVDRGDLHLDAKGRWIERPNSKPEYSTTGEDLRMARDSELSEPVELNFIEDHFHPDMIPQRSKVRDEEQTVGQHRSSSAIRSGDKERLRNGAIDSSGNLVFGLKLGARHGELME